MGDVGSAFLGYSFATLTVLGAQQDPRLALAGLLLVWPFVFHTGFTLIRRWQRGENIFAAHRSHLYQRLVIAGYSHRNVTLGYLTLALLGELLAIFWFFSPRLGAMTMLLCLPLLAFALWFYVCQQERHPVKSHSSSPIAGEITLKPRM